MQKHADLFRQHARRTIDYVALIVLALVGLGGGMYVISQHQEASVIHPQADTAAAGQDEPLRVRAPSTADVQIQDPAGMIPPVSSGLAPVIAQLPVKEKVVFLTIDDGANKENFELQMVKDNGIRASLFLAERFISDNPGFFKPFVSAGSVIEDHSMTHPLFSHLSYDQQKAEICGEADLQVKEFGRRPILFRPPGGDYNVDTQRAAAACGMKAVVLWIAKANGGSMQYQTGNRLRPGDIVLMHFRPEFKADMQAFLDAQNAVGLHTELLEDYLSD